MFLEPDEATVGSAMALNTSYLKDRYQRVLINSTSRLWGKINNGVPQGSIHDYNRYACIKFMYQYSL